MRKFNKPDLGAPRFRPKAHQIVNDDFIKQFKEKYPKYSHYTAKQIREQIKICNEAIWNETLIYRDGIELPENLGHIFIGNCPHRKYEDNIDYGKSIKYDTLITNKNWDSDGNLCKIFYTNYAAKYKVADRQIWRFQGCRKFTRAASKAFSNNSNMYIKVDSLSKVSRLYKKEYFKHYLNNKQTLDLDTYNEFDL